MKVDYVHKDSRTLEEKPQVFARWIDLTIEELKQENQSLKNENKILRENAEHNDKVVDKVNSENQSLKKQLEEYQQELEKADSITQSCIFNGKKESKISYRKCLNMLEKHKNQQKEFIEYLENEIKERNIQIEGYHPTTQLLIEQIIETEKKVLSKYKEIIGVSDENNT